MSSRYEVKTGDQVIETYITGEGNAVILHPGGSQDADNFVDFAEGLASAGFKAVAVNTRGRGQSTGLLDDNVSLHDFAQDLASVIEFLKLEPAHVLGHAFGNRVARCLASDRPELVHSLILLACGGQVRPEPHVLNALRSMGSHSTKEEMKEIYRVALVSPKTNGELLDEIVMKKRSFELLRYLPIASENTPMEEWVSGGKAPMLIVQGLDDQIAVPANGVALKEKFGNRVELIDIPDAGHEMIYEQPEAVLEATVNFLKTLD